MDNATPDIWARLGARLGAAPLWSRGMAGLLIVYAAFYLLIDANALRYPYLLTPAHNPNVAEAAAMLEGRLTLDARYHDTAEVDGEVYNVYPPMFTLISLATLPWSPEGVHILVLVLLAVPLPALAYALFRRLTDRVWPATVLTLGYLFGTSMLPVLNRALGAGEVYHVNHLLSQLGLLILLLDYFGRRRIWVGGLGLLVAAWSRQLTVAYLIPLFYTAAVGRAGAVRPRVVAAALCAVVIGGLPALLNTWKFGNMLETGYRHIYEGVETQAADRARETGLFALRYVPGNLYHMNVGPPLARSINGIVRFEPNPTATGIWWTTPLLLYLWVDARRWWADRDRRVLVLASVVVMAGLLAYHASGWLQPGYNRFSLDYVVVWLAVLAPRCRGPRRRVFTAVSVAWSVWYFRWAI